MKARMLNQRGIQAFREYLEALKGDLTLRPPVALLTDAVTSEALPKYNAEVEYRLFASRYDAASYLDSQLTGLHDLSYNQGFWAWLALFYFDELSPIENGIRFVGAEARYIPGAASWRYYRHL